MRTGTGHSAVIAEMAWPRIPSCTPTNPPSTNSPNEVKATAAATPDITAPITYTKRRTTVISRAANKRAAATCCTTSRGA
jgi:hypothetical protein